MEKIKLFIESDTGKDILVIIIIILVGLGSFGLGRLSKNEPTGLKIEYKGQEASTLDSINQINEDLANKAQNSNFTENSKKSVSGNFGNYFASSKGSKYYSISCSAGKTIKQENRIYFATGGEAEKAGFKLSSACK